MILKLTLEQHTHKAEGDCMHAFLWWILNGQEDRGLTA